GLILFGAIVGMQESVMRAGVAEITGASKRATAYGILNTGFGIGFFLGSSLMGFLYDFSISYLILFSIASEILAFGILVLLLRQLKS
ncbi:MAG: MFS transporter, partial [Archaeoglobaceae archaeon]